MEHQWHWRYVKEMNVFYFKLRVHSKQIVSFINNAWFYLFIKFSDTINFNYLSDSIIRVHGYL